MQSWRYTHVLAAVDLEDPGSAVVVAARRVAESHSARLTVLTVLPQVVQLFAGLDLMLEPNFERAAEGAAERELKALCRKHSIPPGRARVETGTPAAAIADFARTNDADLVVVGTHARHGLERVVGTTATAVLGKVGRDILGVRRSDSAIAYRRIVVAVDGLPGSSRILERARAFHRPGTELHIVLVIRPLFSGYGVDPDDFARDWPLEEVNATLHRRLIDTVRSLADGAGLDGVAVEALHGTPYRQITRYLDRNSADLVIVGAGAHAGGGWAMGSTANRILHEAACDTLVIRNR